MNTPLVREPELLALCAIARRAAAEIMAVYAAGFASWSKDDASPVTEADLRADAVIREALELQFPGVYILSEESAPPPTGASDPLFLVDPLDGTKEFIARNGEFTVNIALVQAGVPVAGVVLAPALGELFFAGRGLGAWLDRPQGPERLRVAPAGAGEPLRVIASRSHGGDGLADWLAALARNHRIVNAGSSLKFCRIAQGLADVYPRPGRTCQWDTAAGQAVLEAAGGAVLGADGQPVTYGLHRSVYHPGFIALADPGLALPPLP